MKNFDFNALSPSDVQEIHQLAQNGGHRLQYALGLMYEQGNAVEQNIQLAFDWYMAAAQQGFAPAINNVGLMYENAQRVAEAAPWYLRAAELGFPPAQENIGALYAAGNGVEVDITQAIFWYEQAFAQGLHHLAAALAYLHHQQSNPPNLSQAVHWYMQASALGDIRSTYNLALFAYQGEADLPVRPVVAYALLEYLALRNVPAPEPELTQRISPKLAQLSSILSPSQIQFAQVWLQSVPSTSEQFWSHLQWLWQHAD